MRGRWAVTVSREENRHFYAPAALCPREAPPFPLDIRLPGAQSWTVCSRDEKKICAFAGNQPPICRSSNQYLSRYRNDLFRLRGIANGNPKTLGHTEGPGWGGLWISFRVDGRLSWLMCFVMSVPALLFKPVFVWFHIRNLCTSRSQWPRRLRPLACWDCGFESRRMHGYLSLVIFVYCQLEASASGWSLVQRSPAQCGVSECDREASQGEALTRNRIEALQNKKILCSQEGGSHVCRVANYSTQPLTANRNPSFRHGCQIKNRNVL